MEKIHRFIIYGDVSNLDEVHLYQFTSNSSIVVFNILANNLKDAFLATLEIKKLSWIASDFRISTITEINDPLLLWRAKMKVYLGEIF